MLDELVRQRKVPNRNEAIRTAIHDYLLDEGIWHKWIAEKMLTEVRVDLLERIEKAEK